MRDPSLTPRVFISHAKTDAKIAQDIAAALEARGVACWIAPRDVEPGRNFGDEIVRGIDACPAFILMLSQASNGSDFVAKELATAVGKRKTVFPIRIEEVQPLGLRSHSSSPAPIGLMRSEGSSARKLTAWRAFFPASQGKLPQFISRQSRLRGRAGDVAPLWRWRPLPL
jgi:TIR domain